ncbi:pectin acetylesterase 8-like isoform X2 [Salvia splendens]|uniref:pectin acetylesterase 8-like isoform X2 n=1 Tax=Salvia splendens TaxID=180675 RepID=UPI001C259049|nr:pectin acetylesterase 8-like isoform X2 [Salvia splendens]
MGSISHNQVTVSICFKIILYVLAFIVSQVDAQNAAQELNITFIADAITKGAVCLDGTPGAYYFAKGFGDGINSWMVYLPGGGWCSSKEDCLKRSHDDALGSNKNAPPKALRAFQSQNKNINPDFYNWNMVEIRYCDGASFMADVEAVNPETKLYQRGRRIFSFIIEELMSTQGMSNAENALLVGTSAGGLATILNCDRFHSYLPSACRVKCISDSGFFIRAEHLRGAQDNIIYKFCNTVLFHELAEFLPKSCTQRHAPELCFLPENVVNDIRTPLFLLNSDFDRYQLGVHVLPNSSIEVGWRDCLKNDSSLPGCTKNNILPCCMDNQLQLIMDFQTTFLKTLEKLDDNPSRGLFITSCYDHDFIYKSSNWQGIPTLQNKASFMSLFAYMSRIVDSHFDLYHDLNYSFFMIIFAFDYRQFNKPWVIGISKGVVFNS